MNRANPEPIAAFLAYVREHGGTDLHLTAGAAPLARLGGVLQPIPGAQVLTVSGIEQLAAEILEGSLSSELEAGKEVDFAFDFNEGTRFRGNAFRAKGTLAFAFRLIPEDIPSFDELGLPPIVGELVTRPQGLVLVTGPTGSGKSTTLASMIDWINTNRRCHIITIEDPIEYLHSHKQSAVNQREVGPDVDDFYTGLRSALREDPDVLLVGEMRDPESISVAMSIAETGHLVFATLHTNDTAQALDRIVDVFPSDRRDQIQVQLSSTLQAVIYQRLLPRVDGGLVAAFEIMRANHAVRNLIREGKTRQLRNVLATHQSEGMQTLEMALSELVSEGAIDLHTALSYTLFPKDLHRLVERGAMLDDDDDGVPRDGEGDEMDSTPSGGRREPLAASGRRGLRRRG